MGYLVIKPLTEKSEKHNPPVLVDCGVNRICFTDQRPLSRCPIKGYPPESNSPTSNKPFSVILRDLNCKDKIWQPDAIVFPY